MEKIDYYADLVYWKVGQSKFRNKMSALKYLVDNQLPESALEFSLFDEAFSRFDWTTPPERPYQDLLRERCEMLRDKYDYLRLWYSGGPDSHTILRTFLDNGIPIDEIALYRCAVSGDFESPTNREINESALPFLRSIQSDLGKTKITVLDLGPQEYRRFFSREDWHYKSNILRFRPYCRSFFYDLFPHLWEPVTKGLRHVNIIGKDKPRITRHEGEYFHFYWDGMLTSYIGTPFAEFFYLSPELPELHSKQCHMAKEYFERFHPRAENIDDFFRMSDLSWLNNLCRQKVFRDVMFEKTGEIVSPKSIAAMDEGRKFAPDILDLFMKSMEQENKSHTWRFNDGNIFNDIKGTSSRRHSLGHSRITEPA